MEEQYKIYLDIYLSSLSETERKKYQSFSSDYFCADEHNANLCAELIRIGQKTATCSLNHWYESGEARSVIFLTAFVNCQDISIPAQPFFLPSIYSKVH